jgi:6-phosphogluconate dehydrogenase (decarboxylating)
MAIAIAEAGYPLHVWSRRPSSLEALGNVAHIRHDTNSDLAASCDIVALCVSTDEDVIQIVTHGLLDGMRPGSVLVNHGTGTPSNAVRLTEICAREGVDVLDAPVSGGRPAALARTLTTMVGGPQPVAQRCEPLFSSFSQHVVYLGSQRSGQTAKLLNNALLIMNQANIADIVEPAIQLGEEQKSQGLRIQVLCPGVVATEFHERQGLDLSAVPRMSADDVVTASLLVQIQETVCVRDAWPCSSVQMPRKRLPWKAYLKLQPDRNRSIIAVWPGCSQDQFLCTQPSPLLPRRFTQE